MIDESLRTSYSSKNDIKFDDLTPGSHKKVLWVCDLGHEYESAVYNKIKGRKCPYCAGRKILVGFNDLASSRPDLAAEWSDKNPMTAQEVTRASNKKVWWQCSKGHEWQTTPSNRTCGDKTNCPYCAGRYVITGENDLLTKYPGKAAGYSKKNKLPPDQITFACHKKVWWECDQGHEWQAQVSNITLGNKWCPYCSNKKVLRGYNDLATVTPELAKQWSPKNTVKPTEIPVGSGIEVLWICEKGHEWKKNVYSRSKGYNCPVCSNYKIIVGINDLATTHPDLAKEWSDKNILKPTEVVAGSHEKYWRKCIAGKHEDFEQSLVGWKKYGCFKCGISIRVSKGEQAVADYVKSLDIDIIQSDRQQIKPLELDIYIPEINAGIEFNGTYWHGFPEQILRDEVKAQRCKEAGVELFVVREEDWIADEEETKRRILLFINFLRRINAKIT